jgi:hypothetical protein
VCRLPDPSLDDPGESDCYFWGGTHEG